ncbi:MAG TPA: hypothetical protein VFL36_00675 [Myxococcales bacterium]|nr:hypothetical protein [Myxococcales bacterium]
MAVAAAWALWIVAAQAFLWTPLLRSLINAHTPAVHVEYRSAWSIFPGTVQVRGLVITAQDRHMQWRLGIDSARASIAMGQLASKIFHATRVRAQGVTFAMRHRLVEREARGANLVGLPAIEGFPAVPLQQVGPEDEIPDWRYHLFSIWLENVEGKGVRQVWIDRFRLEGQMEVAGAFYLKPMRQVLIAPAELALAGSALTFSGGAVANGIEGKLRLRLGPLDPREAWPERFFHALGLEARLRGHLDDLVEARGSGEVALVLGLEAGRVLQGSAFDLSLADLAYRDLRAAQVEAHLRAGPALQARLSLRDARGAGAALASAQVEAQASPPDLADPALPSFLSVDLGGGRIADARALARRLGAGGKIERGHGTFAAHLEGPPRRMTGWARASLAGLRGRARDVDVDGDARIDAVVRALDLEGEADLSGTRIEVSGARLAGADIDPQWWAHIQLPRAHLRFERLAFDADLTAQCRDARPILGLYGHLKDLPGFVQGLFAMEGLAVRGSAAGGPGWFALRDLVAKGDGASIEAALRSDARGQRGAALLDVRGISLALDLNGGHSSLHPFGPGDFFAQRKAELDAVAPARGRRGPVPRR